MTVTGSVSAFPPLRITGSPRRTGEGHESNRLAPATPTPAQPPPVVSRRPPPVTTGSEGHEGTPTPRAGGRAARGLLHTRDVRVPLAAPGPSARGPRTGHPETRRLQPPGPGGERAKSREVPRGPEPWDPGEPHLRRPRPRRRETSRPSQKRQEGLEQVERVRALRAFACLWLGEHGAWCQAHLSPAPPLLVFAKLSQNPQKLGRGDSQWLVGHVPAFAHCRRLAAEGANRGPVPLLARRVRPPKTSTITALPEDTYDETPTVKTRTAAPSSEGL